MFSKKQKPFYHTLLAPPKKDHKKRNALGIILGSVAMLGAASVLNKKSDER